MEMLNTNNIKLVLIMVIICGASIFIGSQVITRSTLEHSDIHDNAINNTSNPLNRLDIEGNVIKIGYISSDTSNYVIEKQFIEKIVQPDINSYFDDLPYDVNFEFVIEDAKGTPVTYYEIVERFRSDNINLIIGGVYSSQAAVSVSYINDNNMVLISTGSVSPTLSIANDRFFRMCYADDASIYALADMLWASGVREIIIIQDSSADSVFLRIFNPFWKSKGGTSFESEARYSSEFNVVNETLNLANAQAKRALEGHGGNTDHVGVLFLAHDDASILIKNAVNYSEIYSLNWYVGEWIYDYGDKRTTFYQSIFKEAQAEANHLKLYSLVPQKPNSTIYTKLEERYTTLTNHPFSVEYAYLYDAAFAVSLTVLETGSQNASKIADAFPAVCEQYYGASGWCKLNDFGDRSSIPYDLWSYTPGTHEPYGRVIVGSYNPDTMETDWIRE